MAQASAPPRYVNDVEAGISPSAPPPETSSANGEEEIKTEQHFAFSDISIRRQFVRKVFTLVFIMLLVVTACISVPFIWPSVMDWMNDNIWFMITAVCVYLVTAILLICVQPLRRTHPWNLILLTIFTISCGIMLMSVSVYTYQSVLVCMAMTCAASAIIIVFAMFVNKDLTSMFGIAYMLTWGLIFFGIAAGISAAISGSQIWYTVYGALGAILFMFWLAIDVQLIMGGRRFAISPEEYVLAALTIFLDIVNIFLYLLQIFGKLK